MRYHPSTLRVRLDVRGRLLAAEVGPTGLDGASSTDDERNTREDLAAPVGRTLREWHSQFNHLLLYSRFTKNKVECKVL